MQVESGDARKFAAFDDDGWCIRAGQRIAMPDAAGERSVILRRCVFIGQGAKGDADFAVMGGNEISDEALLHS